MRSRPLTVGIAALALALALAVGLIWFALSSDPNREAGPQRTQLSQINITLKHGQPVPEARRFEVKVGGMAQVTLRSDELGEVGVGLNQPFEIDMTTNPFVFDFLVSEQRDYPITFKGAGARAKSVVIAVVGGR